MKILITLMGPSLWGLFNSIWGTIRSHGYVPDRVYVLRREADVENSEKARKMIQIILKEYGSRAEIIFQNIEWDNVRDVVEKVRRIAASEKGEKNELALDVTPGRKAVVLGSLLAGWREHTFDHVFYLYIESLRNAARPFILIPLSVQHSHDIIKEAG